MRVPTSPHLLGNACLARMHGNLYTAAINSTRVPDRDSPVAGQAKSHCLDETELPARRGKGVHTEPARSLARKWGGHT